MRDQWLRLIVPGALFLIWVVNQLLNKELKPNPADRPAGLGPRPGGLPPAPRPQARDPRDPTMRFTGTPPARPSSSRIAADDDIIVIRAEPSRRPASSGAARRSTRPKPPPPRPVEPASARVLTPGVSQKIDRPIDHQSLVETPTSLSQSTPAATSTGLGITPAPTAIELRQILGSQQALREAFLINELLQPPLSMRRLHRR